MDSFPSMSTSTGLNLQTIYKKSPRKTNTSSTNGLLKGLIKNERYFFRVRAYTKEGPGPFSATYNAPSSRPAGKLCF